MLFRWVNYHATTGGGKPRTLPMSQMSFSSWRVSLFSLWLTLSALVGLAQNPTIPARPNPPRLVNDLAGLLQPGEAQALEQKLLAYNDSTSSQIAVVTIPTLEGSDIESYAQALYQSWSIGRKGKDNGILILVANQEHKVRIQPGYGLEGAIPDAVAGRIIRETMAPAFKQNQYYAGLDQATTELIARAKGEYKGDPADQERAPRGRSGSGWRFWLIIAGIILFVLLRSRGGGGRNRGGGGGLVSSLLFADFVGGRGGGGGFGGGGGGGFGGFGGGSSGGGGASGSW